VASGQQIYSTAIQGGVRNYNVEFSPDGQMVAFGDEQANIHLWKIGVSAIITLPHQHIDKVFRVAFSSDGKLLASVSAYGQLIIWDVVQRAMLLNLDYRELFGLSGQPAVLEDVEFSPDGRTVVTGGRDKLVRIWSLDNPN